MAAKLYDLDHLDDLGIIQKTIKSPPLKSFSFSGGKNKIMLEDEQGNYIVTVGGIPSDCVVIKGDTFEVFHSHQRIDDSNSILNDERGERKKPDYIIICESSEQKIIFHIELKKDRQTKSGEILKKLKASKCFMEYICAIGREFWKQDFLDDKNYTHRYIAIAKFSAPRPSLGQIKGVGDSPENRRSVYGRQYVKFRELLGN